MVVGLSGKTQLTAVVPVPYPPEVLASRARDILQRIGFDETPADSVVQFYRDSDHLAWIEEHDDSPDRWDQIATGRPSVLSLLYRQSPTPLVASEIGPFHSGRGSDPPHEQPGMIRMWMEPSGDLRALSIVPPARSTEPAASSIFDWTILFEVSGLDADSFRQVAPEWTPDVPSDNRLAWEGLHPGTDLVTRIEAGSFAGRPVFWTVLMPWDRVASDDTADDGPGSLVVTIAVLMVAVVLGGAIALARRNVRQRRGDRKGAFRLAVFVLVLEMLTWLLGDHHVASVDQINVFFSNLGMAVFSAVLVWVFYLALEPFVRKLWPQRLTSWVRLVDGRWKDPLVGRDLLLAGIVGVGWTLMEQLLLVAPAWLGHTPSSPADTGFVFIEQIGLLGGRHFLSIAAGSLSASLTFVLMMVVLLLVLRLLLRRQWAAVLVFLAIMVLSYGPETVPIAVSTALQMTLFLFALLRIGLLAALAGMQFYYMTTGFPMILDGSSWFLTYSVLGLVLILVPVVWGFYIALAGRPIFADLGDD